ncbi:MAG: Arm DNA-binding domain-containing protein [Desulfobacterales bacterium]
MPWCITLGTYPAMSLAKAREKHSTATQDVANGIDPGRKHPGRAEAIRSVGGLKGREARR